MTRNNPGGILGVLMLIVLTIGVAACSVQTPDPASPADSDVVSRNIKVYESPT